MHWKLQCSIISCFTQPFNVCVHLSLKGTLVIVVIVIIIVSLIPVQCLNNTRELQHARSWENELFSLLTCPHTTTLTLPSIKHLKMHVLNLPTIYDNNWPLSSCLGAIHITTSSIVSKITILILVSLNNMINLAEWTSISCLQNPAITEMPSLSHYCCNSCAWGQSLE